LNKVIETYPELEVTALLRSPSRAFADKYPAVKVAKGDFDAFDVIAASAEAADVVIREYFIATDKV